MKVIIKLMKKMRCKVQENQQDNLKLILKKFNLRLISLKIKFLIKLHNKIYKEK